MKKFKDINARNAFFIGGLCAISYMTVYIGRNMLSATTPQIIDSDGYTTKYIGAVSSLFFAFYAIGQLINGMIGDKIKAKYMLGCGLAFAGICNAIFPYIIDQPLTSRIVYGISGFFLSMIYAPMVKLVAENTKPIYTIRCSMAYDFAANFGTPVAGMIAALFVWKSAFRVSSIALIFMGIMCLTLFGYMEKCGVVKWSQYRQEKEKGVLSGIKTLIKRRIVKFVLIAIVTGVVRTSVMFWLPTYIAQYLGFTAQRAASIFTVASVVVSMATFVAVFVYERLRRNMDLTILVAFLSAVVCFLLTYLIKLPVINIIFLVVGILSSNVASSMMWSRYCPSLRETGLVSSATGFLDFISYMAAAATSTIFANAVSAIGWRNLVLVWVVLMVLGVVIAIPGTKLCKGEKVWHET